MCLAFVGKSHAVAKQGKHYSFFNQSEQSQSLRPSLFSRVLWWLGKTDNYSFGFVPFLIKLSILIFRRSRKHSASLKWLEKHGDTWLCILCKRNCRANNSKTEKVSFSKQFQNSARSAFIFTIIDLATYFVVREGKITPITEYVKNTIITPVKKSGSLVAVGKDT